MQRVLFIIAIVWCTPSWSQKLTNEHTGQLPETPSIITSILKMDTAQFWNIMDNAFQKGKFDNKPREQAILEELIKLTPGQIQEFEMIFQQMNKKSSTWEISLPKRFLKEDPLMIRFIISGAG